MFMEGQRIRCPSKTFFKKTKKISKKGFTNPQTCDIIYNVDGPTGHGNMGH